MSTLKELQEQRAKLDQEIKARQSTLSQLSLDNLRQDLGAEVSNQMGLGRLMDLAASEGLALTTTRFEQLNVHVGLQDKAITFDSSVKAEIVAKALETGMFFIRKTT